MAVGFDVGIKNSAYDSDGFVTPNPQNLKKILKPLARVQRKISGRQFGSNNRKKAIRWYQVIHERVANRRKDFQHKLSTIYARKYDAICVEKLQLTHMVKNPRLSRSIMDSSSCFHILSNLWWCFLIPPQHTGLPCIPIFAGMLPKPKSLAVRIHRCGKCNLVMDRDYNASINILNKAIPQELRKLTPVEISMRSMKQEAHVL